MTRRLLASIAAISISATTLAACGSEKTATTEAGGSSTTAESSTTTTATSSSMASSTTATEAGATPTTAKATTTTAAPAAKATLTFTANQVDGTPFDTAARAGKDIVLWFWAPWCTVCRAEAPDLIEAAKAAGDKVEFVGVAGRGGVDEMKAFIDETGTSTFVSVVDDDGAIWAEYGVTAQPAFAFVNQDGTVETYKGSLNAEEIADYVAKLAAK